MSTTTIPEGHHRALVLPSEKAGHLSLTTRPTPTPGPNEVLIKVSSIAFNLIDYAQRDLGFPPLSHYPSILGSDIAGTIVSMGPIDTSSTDLQIGTKVCAAAQSYFVGGAPDYGAFQEYVLVPTQYCTILPSHISFNQGSLIPMTMQTVWTGLLTVGHPLDTRFSPEDKKGIVIWGGASGVGSTAVQVFKSFGYKTYVTASAKHHAYLRGLGADQLFDYHDADVVEQIVGAVRRDGVGVELAYNAVIGGVEPSIEILQAVKTVEKATLASAVHVGEGFATFKEVEGVVARFTLPPTEVEERNRLYAFFFNEWTREKLRSGDFKPCPERMIVVPGGLEAVDQALDLLKKGVSNAKVLVEL